MNLAKRVGTVYVVTTRPGEGRGGISSALAGFLEVLGKSGVDTQLVESHREHDRWRAFFHATMTLARAPLEGRVVWLHCGPWVSTLRKFLLGAIAKTRGATVLFHLHSPTLSDYLAVPWKRALLGPLVRLADGVLVLTPWWQELIEEAIPELVGRVCTCPNPLNSVLEDLAREPLEECSVHRSAEAPVRILSLARLIPEKGIDNVVKALALLDPRFHLTVAGDGPHREALERLVAELGLCDRVEFLGWISGERKIEWLRSSDVYCLPSRYDSFGMTFIEAMASGLPVVALNREAIPDVVPNQVAGILLDTDSPSSLAGAIEEAYQARVAMGLAGRRHVLKSFSQEGISLRLLMCFDRCLHGGQRFTQFCSSLSASPSGEDVPPRVPG